MAEQCLPIPPNIAELAGPQLLGHMFNWGLFGVLSVQVYIYTLAFPDDPRKMKIIVYGLYFLECVQVTLATHDAFATLGAGWGSLAALNNPQWLWFDTPVMSGFISACVQIFFAWRIYLLTKSILLGGVICGIAIAQGVGAMITGILVHVISNVSELQARTFKTNIVWLGGSALCDIIIACCMFYSLSKSHTGYAPTDQLLSRLVRLTVETGMITASVAILDLILFFSFPHSNIHMAPALTLAKLYTNSLMALFNNRARISKGGPSPSQGSSFSLKPVNLSLSQRGRPGTHSFNGNTPGAIAVGVTKETVTDTREMGDLMYDEDSTHDLPKGAHGSFTSHIRDHESKV